MDISSSTYGCFHLWHTCPMTVIYSRWGALLCVTVKFSPWANRITWMRGKGVLVLWTTYWPVELCFPLSCHLVLDFGIGLYGHFGFRHLNDHYTYLCAIFLLCNLSEFLLCPSMTLSCLLSLVLCMDSGHYLKCCQFSPRNEVRHDWHLFLLSAHSAVMCVCFLGAHLNFPFCLENNFLDPENFNRCIEIKTNCSVEDLKCTMGGTHIGYSITTASLTHL